ncbi:MAG: hypothetical protein HZB38_06380 [Planctomycetes bacterium]|nr:hypothetical protein [Planctomycetota bacterium]
MINVRHLAEDVCILIPFRSVQEVMRAFKEKNPEAVSAIINEVARDVRARVSTFNFPDAAHDVGTYAPSRNLGIATKYLDEISKALTSNAHQQGFDELGWHAFGASVLALAGILTHLEAQGGAAS